MPAAISRNISAARSTSGHATSSGEGSSQPADHAAATPPSAGIPADWGVQPLQPWHLPLLDDPAFLPLQPLLQRAVLLALPARLIHALTPRQPLAPQVLVATRMLFGASLPLGLVVVRPLNRTGSCWQVQHLRLARGLEGDPGRRCVAVALLREAIQRTTGATSWIASAASLDTDRQAQLREQGFQPLRTDRIWRWQPQGQAPQPIPSELQLRRLQRRSGPLLWHLEQAACPAQLRQLLDRRPEDLLDQSQNRGWMLVDPCRDQAVAGVRWLGDHPGGGHDVELSVHPGWVELVGPATELLLQRLAAELTPTEPLWLACDKTQPSPHQWLEHLGAEACGERILMARSVWRRQERAVVHPAMKRLTALLEPLQPRRRPVPSPLRDH
ncbi:hypothetical protein [Synechococcus sp. CCY9202]|uniref:hypothetical protein n=1 Tax=Synechococcus sp. CCY9202 TaxID=174698 RepID=UPI002B21170D|nr:hypothetical protein [Synechococcus sp. CCY9202]MEA5423244.1 hypothetical protein [Synechococcus sp. CCY9202]